MSIQAKFINFHDKIKLSRGDDEYKSARDKDDSILLAVKEKFKAAGYPVVDNFLQGSLSTATAIKHPTEDFDVDRAVAIEFDKAPNDPVAPKKLVLEVLEDRGFKNAKIKKPCVTADYASLKLHIDIPIYRKDGDSYELAIGKKNSSEDGKAWSDTDPKGLRDHINDSSAYIGSSAEKLQQYKRIVRYLKRWRDHKFSATVAKKVFSIALTIMAKDQFVPSLNTNGKPNDLQALRDTVNKIILADYFSYNLLCGKYSVQVDLPVPPYRDIFSGSSLDTGTQLRNKLTVLRNKLDKAIAETDLRKQCEVLNEVFGDDFEVPEKENSASTSKAAYVTAGAVGTSSGA